MRRQTQIVLNTLRLMIAMMLGHFAWASAAWAAEEKNPPEPVTWRIVLCISDTVVTEGGGTLCVVAVSHDSKTPLSVLNTIRVKQYALREDGGAAEDLEPDRPATRPATRPEDPKVAELYARAEAAMQATFGQLPYLTLSIEGHYGPSYSPPMLMHMGLMDRIAIRPGNLGYQCVGLPSSLFQTGEYKLRAHLYRAGRLLAESNVQVIRVAQRAP